MSVKIYLRLSGEEARRFREISKQLGLRTDSEVLRYLIKYYYDKHKDLFEKPRFELFNCDENGCKVHDRQLGVYAQIYFKPKGIICEVCKENNCEHIKFALSQSKIQKIIRKKKLEGWKLPDVE